MAVKVQFEIGHTSKLRSKRTVEGFTHDWELYVKGVQQADISVFVEKIIFRLHESFQNHNRVFKEPPYIVQESGYAGFIVFIDIYFRNRDEPKKVQYNYDLDLQNTGPPHSRSEVKTFIFDNPSEEYRQKLLKGGGVPVSGVVGGQTTINNNTSSLPIVTPLNHSPGDGHKNLVAEGKKHKSRPEDLRSNSFANLFGPPITKTTAGLTTALTKHSPENKVSGVSANHQNSSSSGAPIVKEKSSKDKDKSSEKSKERSSKKDKHHKQSLTSPHKEARSESKKSESNKHEKRDKNEEKPKKDKNRDKDKEREREKSSSVNVNHNVSNNKRPSSPKTAREHSPHKTGSANNMGSIVPSSNANSVPRPSSSNSGKLEELKNSSKSSKDSTGESKLKDSKVKESSSSSSSGKKSKKEKKDKEKDKERRHEEKEKQKLSENQQRSAAKEDAKTTNASNNIPSTTEHKNAKATSNSNVTSNVTHTSDTAKKSEKISKQDLFKNTEKPISNNTPSAPLVGPANNTSHSALNDKKSSSGSSLNSNSNQQEKDKRSHKHKKKEKNKDKDKDKERERDKDREKDKDKERDRDREKEKDAKKEKEPKEKHHEEKSSDGIHTAQSVKAAPTPPVSNNDEPITNTNSSSSSTVSSVSTAPHMPTTTSTTTLSSTSRSSKNKEKKSKEKSSSKEDKLKHKSSEADINENKSKQPKLCTTNSLSASSSSSSVSTPLTTVPTAIQPLAGTSITTTSSTENNMNIELSDTDSIPPVTSEVKKKVAPAVEHSDSSNSSFPDLPLPKQQPESKLTAPHDLTKPTASTTPVAIVTPLNNTTKLKEPPKNIKLAKDKPLDKLSKEEEKDKKRRRNSVAVNTFIEPPLKQPKKEQMKSLREKSKSPSLRNTGSRASISAEASTTFLQPSASPSSTAAAAPLPPPSSAPSAAHSPALSATEAVGNAASATANAATSNSSTTPSSSTNSSSTSVFASHQLPLDYLSELQELHHKIMTLQDNDDLQHVVELIAATGCYEITTKTFDFDLCKLDRGTVQRLQEFFATSVS